MVAAGAIVDESDDLIAELTVFENLVSDQPSQLARPAMRMRFSPMPARQRRSSTSRTSSRDANVRMTFKPRNIAQTSCETSNVARVLGGVGRKVRLHVQRGDDAEDDREDAADEDGEEVVDARAAAAQAVEALQVESDRHEHRDERQDVQVLRERRQALRDRNQARVKADGVGDDEGADAEQRVGDDVERDQQAVVPDHRAASTAPPRSSASISSPKRTRPNRSACWRMRCRS